MRKNLNYVTKLFKNKRGVAGDSITIIISLVVLFVFMILAYYFLNPATVQRAAFSGDHVDVEAEIMLASILKTQTSSGNGLDAILNFASTVDAIGESSAEKKVLRELLPENPLRYYYGDWILMVWDGDVTQPSISAEGDGPRRWDISNPLQEGKIVERSIQRTDGTYERILNPNSARDRWYELYQQSRPVVVSIDDGKQQYTVQLYLLRGESVDRIVPESYTPRKGIPTSTGKSVSESIFYEPITPDEKTTCTMVSNCDSYVTEYSCTDDPCYASRKFCSWNADRCGVGGAG